MDNLEASAEQLWHALLRAASAVKGELRKEYAQWNLTGPQWAVLRVLAAAEPQGVMLHDISERLLVSCGNTTGVIDRLEELGYVARTAHPDDRRATLAVLTEEGRRVHAEIAPVVRRRVGELLGGLSPEQQGSVAELLTHVVNQVRQSNNQAS